MALSKNKLKERMQANSPKASRTTVPLTNLTAKQSVKPNGANVPNGNLSVPKLKGVRQGVTRTQRYSFEITLDLKNELELALIDYRKKTGKDISKSQVIRNALIKHLRAGKL